MRKSKLYSKFLSSYIKTVPILFSVVFMVGCSAFQIRYETEIKEVVPVGYKYMYCNKADYGIDGYLLLFLSLRNIEIIHRVSEDQSKMLLAEIYVEEGIVFPPTTVYQGFEPIFYIPKTIEIKIYDYSSKKLYAIIKRERGMFRGVESDQKLKFFSEFKKIFINYKPSSDPYEGSY